MKIFARKKRTIETRKSVNGFLFVLPWTIGFFLFFLIPLVTSIAFAFSKVSVTTSGFKMDFIGLENFRFAFFDAAKYVDNLSDSISGFFYQIPIILVVSLIIAVALNSKFKGRAFFRMIFFIPVIISTGVIIDFLLGDSVMEEMRSAGGSGGSVYLSGLIDFDKLFMQLGLPSSVTTIISDYVNEIFNLIWKSGIQIVLFISGLQSIPDQLYEVSKVEGATKLQEFWHITIPMLANTIILVMIFSTIDFCVSTDNKVMEQAYTILLDQQNYHESAAMMWAYFAIIGAIIGLVFLIMKKSLLKKWE